MQQSHENCGTDYRLIILVHRIQQLILKLSTKPKFHSTSVHSLLLKVRQSRNDFFKLTILPKHERTNMCFLLNSAMIELFRSFFLKNSRIAKSHFEINWPLDSSVHTTIDHLLDILKKDLKVFFVFCYCFFNKSLKDLMKIWIIFFCWIRWAR